MFEMKVETACTCHSYFLTVLSYIIIVTYLVYAPSSIPRVDLPFVAMATRITIKI